MILGYESNSLKRKKARRASELREGPEEIPNVLESLGQSQKEGQKDQGKCQGGGNTPYSTDNIECTWERHPLFYGQCRMPFASHTVLSTVNVECDWGSHKIVSTFV